MWKALSVNNTIMPTHERGGIWNYIEKPGWDFQMSSRVPLAGRATEPIATYTTGDVVPWKGGSRASLDPLTQLP